MSILIEGSELIQAYTVQKSSISIIKNEKSITEQPSMNL